MNRSTTSRIQWFLTIAGLAGIASIFLPFTGGFLGGGVSPMDVFRELGIFPMPYGSLDFYIWRLAVPLILPIFIGILAIRWNFSGRLSLAERIFSYLIGILSALITLSCYKEIYHHNDIWGNLVMSVPIFVLIIGVFFWVKNYRKGKFKDFSSIIAMQVAYLAGSTLCLIGFFQDWHIGAYFTLVTVIVYSVQMIWISCQKKEIIVKEQI